MAIILSIETSSKSCSAAIHQNGVLLALCELINDKSSSAMLTTAIADCAKLAGLTLSELDAIAVAKGPGSFTGLRIAVSTAKGLCFSLDKPLLSVNTLEAIAWQLQPFYGENTLLCPMLDARRMEVYCAVFDAQTMQFIEETQAKIISETSFEEHLASKKMVFFGDGAAKCMPFFIANKNAFLVENIYPSAKTIGILAERAFNQNLFEDVSSFEPFYLKEFVGTVKKIPIA
jgi:tRNA threonylcarbamoyladenosine biosynthesis protein TsaB